MSLEPTFTGHPHLAKYKHPNYLEITSVQSWFSCHNAAALDCEIARFSQCMDLFVHFFKFEIIDKLCIIMTKYEYIMYTLCMGYGCMMSLTDIFTILLKRINYIICT